MQSKIQSPLSPNFSNNELSAKNREFNNELAEMIYATSVLNVSTKDYSFEAHYCIPRIQELISGLYAGKKDAYSREVLQMFMFVCATGWDITYIQKLIHDDLKDASFLSFSRSIRYHAMDFVFPTCGAAQVFNNHRLSVAEFDRHLHEVFDEFELSFNLARQIFFYQSVVREEYSFERIAKALHMPTLYESPFVTDVCRMPLVSSKNLSLT